MKIILDATEVTYLPGSNNHSKNGDSTFEFNNIGREIDEQATRIMALQNKISSLEMDAVITKHVIARFEEYEARDEAERELRKNSKPLQAVWDKYQFTKDMVTDPNKESE